MQQPVLSAVAAQRDVESEARAEGVYRSLLRAIIAGEHIPGSRLKERELSERHEVSRIPVRQALQRLESEGFVITEPRRGAIVKPLSRADVEELFDARLCIEPFATKHAAQRIASGVETPQRLAELLDGATQHFEQGDDAEGISENLQFHAEIVRLSGNSLLIRSLQPMLGRMEWIFRLTHTARETDQPAEHRQLADALMRGNADLAASLAYAHIEMGRAPTLTALAPFLAH